MAQRTHVHVAILGSGFAGLGAAIRLKQAGFDDFVLLEKAGDVGGVWRENVYPGCACDVQSHLYSFSFAPNPGWSRRYSPSPEIWQYLRDCADRFGVRPHCRFHTEVREARWDEAALRWRLETSQGPLTADVFVAAPGALHTPAIPHVPGLADFPGKVMHSAQWDPSYALTGKRVAVIGTGASAVQFVPAIQPQVQKLHLFQRTAAWVIPRKDRAISEGKRRLYAKVPLVRRFVRRWIDVTRDLYIVGFHHRWITDQVERFATRHLERSIPDPVLRAKVTPNFRIGCKRVLISDDYLPALTRPNVEVIAHGLREVRGNTVIADDGTAREVDAILLGTGFHVTDMPIAERVWGRGGRSLNDAWQGSPKAHVATTVAGFPNFFLLSGPNSGLGHTSVILMIEAQLEHLLGALRYLDGRGVAAVEPTEEAQAAFVAEVDAKMRGTVWVEGDCHSWYLDQTGRNSTLWPGFVRTFERRVRYFDPAEYLATPRQSAHAFALETVRA